MCSVRSRWPWSVAQAEDMLAAVNRTGVRHMTAFTYRFVPAMRYFGTW